MLCANWFSGSLHPVCDDLLSPEVAMAEMSSSGMCCVSHTL